MVKKWENYYDIMMRKFNSFHGEDTVCNIVVIICKRLSFKGSRDVNRKSKEIGVLQVHSAGNKNSCLEHSAFCVKEDPCSN